MLNACKLLILFVSATVAHWLVAWVCAWWGISANTLLVFVVAFCAVFNLSIAYSAAFICGLFLDFFSTKLFGNTAFTFTVCACIVCNLAPRFDFDELFPQMIAVFSLTWLVGCLNTLLIYLFASSSTWPGFFSLLGGAVVNALCAPFVFWFVRRVMGTSSLLRQV